MAASIPLPFKPHTPPPDLYTFLNGLSPQTAPLSAHGLRQTTASTARENYSGPASQRQQPSTTQIPDDIPPCHPAAAAAAESTTAPAATAEGAAAAGAAAAAAFAADATASAAAAAVDPRYAAMASRIASYYQQRCAAVARFQQQRCAAWASAQRQRCQEMMRAATVIVAWYVRDRIARRRRRRRRRFRRGLGQRDANAAAEAARAAEVNAAGVGRVGGAGRGKGREKEKGVGIGNGRITKGEAVRRWLMNVPLSAAAMAGGAASGSGPGSGSGSVAASPSDPTRDLPADKEEIDFDMDRETPADKDSQLFDVANNIIKSHLASVDVPLLGLLSFDESDSESESEYDVMDYEGDVGEKQRGREYGDDEGGETAWATDEDDVEVGGRGGRGGGDQAGLEPGSQHAQLGTTSKGSRKRSRSSVS